MRLDLVVDVETTGLNPQRDEIIELAMRPFNYGLDGTVFSMGDSFQGLRQPSELTVATAISSFLSPDADECQEAAIAKRLDRIDRNIQRLERDIGIATKPSPSSFATG